MRYLGNFSEHPYYDVPMVCYGCGVRWGGCQAASHCPECGMPVDFETGVALTGEQYKRAMLELVRDPEATMREATSEGDSCPK